MQEIEKRRRWLWRHAKAGAALAIDIFSRHTMFFSWKCALGVLLEFFLQYNVCFEGFKYSSIGFSFVVVGIETKSVESVVGCGKPRNSLKSAQLYVMGEFGVSLTLRSIGKAPVFIS